MILATRILPFIFSRILKNSRALQTIGRYLPAYIMIFLVIFEIGISHFTKFPYAIPSLLALICVIVAQLYKRQMLISMVVGVVAFYVFSLFF